MILFIQFLLTVAVCWMIACRIDKMNKGVTQQRVFLQHFLLGVAVFASFIVGFTSYKEWSAVILSVGVLQFFTFSIGRWRKHAPDDTVKEELTELPRDSWPHVVGGKK